MLQVNQVKLQIEHTQEQLYGKIAELLKVSRKDIWELEILRQSIDARKKPDIFYTYTVNVCLKDEEKVLRRQKGRLQVQKVEPVEYRFPKEGERIQEHPTVIVGMGPAGLFCGYYLALHGYRPLLLERGKDVDARRADVESFWKGGVLCPNSNVQFGEGGAGTFSDGKLNTVVKDKSGRNREVLKTFVRFGAKESILYDAKPHVGTDVLVGIVKSMREEIIRLGGAVRFESCMTDVHIQNGQIAGVVINGKEEIPCENLVLALGHSARDSFFKLYERQVTMEPKAFAVGLRVEHPQEMINLSQYGRKKPRSLGAAPYKVTARTGSGRGVYSFCMCPGGYVVNASSEEGQLAVNGMSYSGRDGVNANSAIIVSVTPDDFGSQHPLAGVDFQRSLERKAYELADGKIPVQRYGDFKCRVEGTAATDEWSEGEDRLVQPSCKGAYAWADVSQILPKECNQAFVEGMEVFGRQIAGFDRPDAILAGVESRTSSPVRMLRDEKLQSVSVRGLYPCGEGAGYAGGITSAAMDGLRVAEAIAACYAPFST
ncbi:MAG: FAD-dependent oxidoreductase [Lachnospiraceae bacterium]|nr:FAD-dependent oxidoreductase [Lachnospiraceae bacterium]